MDLVGIARNPIPSGADCGFFPAADGAKLRYARWQATGQTKKGTICLFTGRGEFIEKYFEVIADLRRRGFAVAAMDWRGQGGSARRLRNPMKGHIRNFRQYDRDLVQFMAEIVLPDCPAPYFALAHSLGGHILLRNARMRNSWFERMVLVAPMIRLARTALPSTASIVAQFADLAVFLGLGRIYVPGGSGSAWEAHDFEGNPLTSDLERFARNAAVLESAPELGLGSPTMGWMRASFKSMRELSTLQFPTTVHVPLLMIAAGDDRVVSTRAIEDLSARLKVGSHIVLAGSRHEILQERDDIRLQFWAAFDAYIPGSA